MTLPNDIARCLGHTPSGKPNGCERLDTCQRHTAIRTTPFDGSCTVVFRSCGKEFDAYIAPEAA